MDFISLLNNVNNFVWGPPLLFLLVGTGIFLTIRLRFIQVGDLIRAFKLIFTAKNEGDGDVSSFASLCTALAATVGTGNIVGVATAIAVGGPGALFWMWIAAFFGMATKYAEGVLAIKYRTIDKNGQVSGGPMYYITRGLGEKYKPLAIFFAISGVFVSLLGVGTFPQVNAIITSTENTLGVPKEWMGIGLAIVVAFIIFKGIQSISNIASKVIPFMALIYIGITVGILILFYKDLPSTFALIFESAFTGTAATGGFLGATMQMALRNGVARGVFSNEAGLGSAPIAAASAKTKEPVEQGLISMTGTFIDSLVICTLTGLSIIVTGVWNTDLKGAAMTEAAFGTLLPSTGSFLLTLCLSLFAFTTILGWAYYGERCIEFLVGTKGITSFRIVFVMMVALGAFLHIDAIWIIADIMNGLMALPNLIALLALSPIVVYETRKYKHRQLQQAKHINRVA